MVLPIPAIWGLKWAWEFGPICKLLAKVDLVNFGNFAFFVFLGFYWAFDWALNEVLNWASYSTIESIISSPICSIYAAIIRHTTCESKI